MLKKTFRLFNEARSFARSLQLKSSAEWHVFSKSSARPFDIPSTPSKTYKTEWQGYGDWLGTGNTPGGSKEFMPYAEAREYVRGLGLSGYVKWHEFSKSSLRPPDIPSNPEYTYKVEWCGIGDWLGTGRRPLTKRSKGPFQSFSQAREFVRGLGLQNHTQWLDYCKSGARPANIPSDPRAIYKAEWQGVGDWLGTGNAPLLQKRNHATPEESRLLLRKMWSKEFATRRVELTE